MGLKSWFLGCFVCILLILTIPLFVFAEESTKVNMYLQDNANLFTPSEAQVIEQTLRNFQTETSVQFVIFTTNKIPKDYSLEEYSLKIAEDNKIGKKGLDTGLLFFISIEDKSYRWETGYGLEDVLNAAWLGRMSRDSMLPFFQEGSFNYGIAAGMEQIIKKVKNTDDADVLPESIRPPQRTRNNSSLWIYGIFFVIFFILPIIRAKSRKQGKDGKHDNNSMLRTAIYLGAASALFGGRGGSGGFGGGFGGMGGGFGGGGFSGGF